MRMRTILVGLTAAVLSAVTGCGTQKVEVIDLDRVLEIFDKVTKMSAQGEEQAADSEDAKIRPVVSEDTKKTAAFLKSFAGELNAAKLISVPIGVVLRKDGAIEGFKDPNKSMTKDGREDTLFTIQIDPDSGRVIATSVVENQTYRRDHHYNRYRWHGHHYGWFLYGNMWGRHRSYYAAPNRNPPTYGTMRMSPRGYHGQAVQRARSAASARSARSRGGSRSFRGGK